ncbi:hypothetical protein Aros01_06439 [Streptosporangium roseum]
MSPEPSGRDRGLPPPRPRPGPTAARPSPPPARSAAIVPGLPRPSRTGAPASGRDVRAPDSTRRPPGGAGARPAASAGGRERAASRLLPGRFPRIRDGGPDGSATGGDRHPALGGPARPGGAPAGRQDRASLSDHDLSPRSAPCPPGPRPPDGQAPAPGPRRIRRVDNRLLHVQAPGRPFRCRPSRPGRAARRPGASGTASPGHRRGPALTAGHGRPAPGPGGRSPRARARRHRQPPDPAGRSLPEPLIP